MNIDNSQLCLDLNVVPIRTSAKSVPSPQKNSSSSPQKRDELANRIDIFMNNNDKVHSHANQGKEIILELKKQNEALKLQQQQQKNEHGSRLQHIPDGSSTQVSSLKENHLNNLSKLNEEKSKEISNLKAEKEKKERLIRCLREEMTKVKEESKTNKNDQTELKEQILKYENDKKRIEEEKRALNAKFDASEKRKRKTKKGF